MKRIYILIAFLLQGLIMVPVWGSPAVNINASNTEVRDVLNVLAAVGQVSMVIDDSVTGKISVQLQEVPFEKALELVCKMKGLTFQQNGQVVVVGSSDRMREVFGGVKVFKIHYAKAEEVANLLSLLDTDEALPAKENKAKEQVHEKSGKKQKTSHKEKTAEEPSASRRCRFDAASNSILFWGTPEEVEQVQNILKAVDVPYGQVCLEAQVVAVNKQASKELGVEWEWSKTTNYPEYTAPKYSVVKNADGTLQQIQTEPGKITHEKQNMSGTISYGRSPAGLPYEFYFNSTIKALVSKGDAKILSKPNVIAISGQEAVIDIGDRVPVAVTTTTNNITTTSVQYEDAGIILRYTPWINEDGYITAQVHTEVSTPLYDAEVKAYRFTKRSADTKVRLKDGQAMVIGGLIGKDEMKGSSRIPYLADLPLLGALFKSSSNRSNESEVIIFLTARIMR